MAIGESVVVNIITTAAAGGYSATDYRRERMSLRIGLEVQHLRQVEQAV